MLLGGGSGKKDYYFPLNIGIGVAAPPKRAAKVLRLDIHTTTHFYNLSMIYYKVNNVEN